MIESAVGSFGHPPLGLQRYGAGLQPRRGGGWPQALIYWIFSRQPWRASFPTTIESCSAARSESGLGLAVSASLFPGNPGRGQRMDAALNGLVFYLETVATRGQLLKFLEYRIASVSI